MDARLMRETMQGSRTETSFRNWTRLAAGRRKKEQQQLHRLQIYGPCRKVHWGTRETQPLIHRRHPATNWLALSTKGCLSTFSKHRTVVAALSTVIQAYRGPRGTLQFRYIQPRSSILSPSGNASVHITQRQLSSLQINLPQASSTIWRLRWAPHALFSPDCQFTETFSSPPPTFSCWLNKRHLYNAYSTLVSL